MKGISYLLLHDKLPQTWWLKTTFVILPLLWVQANGLEYQEAGITASVLGAASNSKLQGGWAWPEPAG